jgi:hypothetical protein
VAFGRLEDGCNVIWKEPETITQTSPDAKPSREVTHVTIPGQEELVPEQPELGLRHQVLNGVRRAGDQEEKEGEGTEVPNTFAANRG